MHSYQLVFELNELGCVTTKSSPCVIPQIFLFFVMEQILRALLQFVFPRLEMIMPIALLFTRGVKCDVLQQPTFSLHKSCFGPLPANGPAPASAPWHGKIHERHGCALFRSFANGSLQSSPPAEVGLSPLLNSRATVRDLTCIGVPLSLRMPYLCRSTLCPLV